MTKLNEYQKNALISILIILMYFIWPTIISIPLQIFNLETTGDGISVVKVCYDLFSNLILLGIILFIYRKSLKENIEDFNKNKKSEWMTIISYTVLVFIGIFLISAIKIYVFDSDTTQNDVELYQYFKEVPWLMTIMTIFYYPIIEEIVFKKTLKNIIQKKWLFIVASALFFGYFNVAFTNMSVLNIVDTLPYITFAAITAHAYYKTDNILVPISIKMIYNIVVTLMLI